MPLVLAMSPVLSNLLMLLFIAVAVIMILIILIQRPAGGGLSGAPSSQPCRLVNPGYNRHPRSGRRRDFTERDKEALHSVDRSVRS